MYVVIYCSLPTLAPSRSFDISIAHPQAQKLQQLAAAAEREHVRDATHTHTHHPPPLPLSRLLCCGLLLPITWSAFCLFWETLFFSFLEQLSTLSKREVQSSNLGGGNSFDTFSAFWLRSSVVSVLISLISDTVGKAYLRLT